MTGSAEMKKASRSLEDDRILQAIKNVFMQRREIPADTIDVIVTEGVVTVSGTVGNLLTKDRVSEVVRGIRGVRAVIDDLTVEVRVREDAAIMEDVVRAFKNNRALQDDDIEKRVEEGFIVLSGTWPSWGERRLAQATLKGIRGIRGLLDRTGVSPCAARTDDDIREEILAILHSDVWIEEGRIHVRVEDGVARLYGIVCSATQETRVRNAAWVEGVRDVDPSGLKVDPWICEGLHGETQHMIVPDGDITKAVRTALAYDPRVAAAHLHVSVRQGVVTLTGSVEKLAAKWAAERDALNVAGVLEVVNDITVTWHTRETDDDLAEAVRTVLRCDPILKEFAITVSVCEGLVSLEGEVPSHFVSDRAAELASGVGGVIKVENGLGLPAAPKPKPDEDLRRDVEEEIFWNPRLGNSAISVTVQNGTVLLRGRTRTWQQKEIATRAALTAGAGSVNNRISVEKADHELFVPGAGRS
jgi:osmotically-inducible protein OsmY